MLQDPTTPGSEVTSEKISDLKPRLGFALVGAVGRKGAPVNNQTNSREDDEDELFSFPSLPTEGSWAPNGHSDVILPMASHDEVTWAHADIGKAYRKLAGVTKDDPMALIMNEDLWSLYQKELSDTCIRMGWDPDLFDDMWTDGIMEELHQEC